MIALRRQAVPLARNPEALAEHFGVGAAAALPHAEAVLFVDDEDELVSAVVERLGLRGIDAVGATSGVEALDLL